MVDVLGHFGMALLWAAPAWILWERDVAIAFIGFVLATAMLPDVDLLVEQLLPISHHGILHTFLFVALIAIAVGLLFEYAFRSMLERALLHDRGYRAARHSLFVFATTGLFLGGASHLFADMLSAPDVAAPLEPFWPLFDKPWSIDLVWYNSPWWNVGLLSVAVTVHLVLARFGVAVDHSYLISRNARRD